MITRPSVRGTAKPGIGCSAPTLATAAVERPVLYEALMLDIANTRWRFDQQTNTGPPCRGASFGAAGGGVSHGMSGPHTVSGGDTVDLPGLWTPAQRRVESDRRRSGRPQPLGNLADDRCRSSLRFRPRDSHSPTAHRRHGHRSSEHDPCTARGSCAGQRGRDDHEGMTTHPEYTLVSEALDLSEQPGPLQIRHDQHLKNPRTKSESNSLRRRTQLPSGSPGVSFHPSKGLPRPPTGGGRRSAVSGRGPAFSV